MVYMEMYNIYTSLAGSEAHRWLILRECKIPILTGRCKYLFKLAFFYTSQERNESKSPMTSKRGEGQIYYISHWSKNHIDISRKCKWDVNGVFTLQSRIPPLVMPKINPLFPFHHINSENCHHLPGDVLLISSKLNHLWNGQSKICVRHCNDWTKVYLAVPKNIIQHSNS